MNWDFVDLSLKTAKPVTPVMPPLDLTPIKLNDMVKVKQGSKSYEGVNVASFVYERPFKVDQLKNDRAVLDIKGICTAFKANCI